MADKTRSMSINAEMSVIPTDWHISYSISYMNSLLIDWTVNSRAEYYLEMYVTPVWPILWTVSRVTFPDACQQKNIVLLGKDSTFTDRKWSSVSFFEDLAVSKTQNVTHQ